MYMGIPQADAMGPGMDDERKRQLLARLSGRSGGRLAGRRGEQVGRRASRGGGLRGGPPIGLASLLGAAGGGGRRGPGLGGLGGGFNPGRGIGPPIDPPGRETLIPGWYGPGSPNPHIGPWLTDLTEQPTSPVPLPPWLRPPTQMAPPPPGSYY